MRKYETPSYEIELFKLENDILTDTSHNSGGEFDWIDGPPDGPSMASEF